MRTINDRFEVLDRCMVPVLQAKAPRERLAIALAMWEQARRLVEAGVRHAHADWTAEQCRWEAARRMSHGAV